MVSIYFSSLKVTNYIWNLYLLYATQTFNKYRWIDFKFYFEVFKILNIKLKSH
jgi:hypothetical protein